MELSWSVFVACLGLLMLALTATASPADRTRLTALENEFQLLGGSITPLFEGAGKMYTIPGVVQKPLEVVRVLSQIRDTHLAERSSDQMDLAINSALSANMAARDLLQDLRDQTSFLSTSKRREIAVTLRDLYDSEIELGSFWRLRSEMVDHLFRSAVLARARDFMESATRRMRATADPTLTRNLADFQSYLAARDALDQIAKLRLINPGQTPRGRLFLSELKRSLERSVSHTDVTMLNRLESTGGVNSGIVTASEFALTIPISTAVVMFHLTENSAFAFVMQRRTPTKLVLLPQSAQRTRELARDFHAVASKRPAPGEEVVWRDVGKALQNALLGPVIPHLDRVDTLVLVPHDDLHIVPFAALPLSDTGELLIDRYSIAQLPTPMFPYFSPSRARSPVGQMLAVGVNEFTYLARLNHAEAEASAVAGFFDDSKLLLASSANADVSSVLTEMPRYELIHIATHGKFIYQAPNASSLVLPSAEERTHDQLLTAADVTGLKLNANLVVLSACETAFPDSRALQPDGEILGLPRAFLLAGARNVIASLWSVDDTATRMFFENFYKTMYWGSQGGLFSRMEVHEALAAAQRQARKRNSHPFFWSGFVMIGAL